jgi:glucose-1-phosphate cytidylyltransferase
VKTIILAGGLGTRISEETSDKPKPMVQIGSHPILWHIMQIYAHQGFKDFLIAAGYKAEVIEEYVRSRKSFGNIGDAISLNTGLHTATGGRIKLGMESIGKERVFATYGDGVADVNLNALIEFHENHGGLATLTAVHPPARFGRIELNGDRVTQFGEKMQSQEGWINGGFFILEPEVADYISSLEMPFEHDPLVNLARDGELFAYKHQGFWQPMDTLRERNELQQLWEMNKAPWKIW